MRVNPFDLHGKSCLVTGASSGIGRAAAKLISECGGKIVATGRDEIRLNRTLDELSGSGHSALPADLLDPDAVSELSDQCPPLNGVVHCAGIVNLAPIPKPTFNHRRTHHSRNQAVRPNLLWRKFTCHGTAQSEQG